MMDWISASKPVLYSIYLLAFFGLFNVYFLIARRFGLLDRPNQRSSHTKATIVGAGIVFYVALILDVLLLDKQLLYFGVGATAVAIVSFLDDRMELASGLRFSIQALAAALMLYQLEIIPMFAWYHAVLIAIVVIGTINAFNFMDGINGITGINAIVIIGTLLYTSFENSYVDLMIVELLALSVFLFYNFRKRAVCFSGDIGSVTIAYVIVFLLLDHMLRSDRWETILLVAVYGVDSVTTICTRLLRRENIFKAHRSHIYQHLVHKAQWSHQKTSVVYGILQALIAIVYLLMAGCSSSEKLVVTLSIFALLTLTSVAIRKRLDVENPLHT